METPLRDYIGAGKGRDNEWEPKARQLSIKKVLESLPKPKVVSYKVSIEQIQALQSSIEAAEQEISNKQKEDDELEDELDRIAAIKQREEAQKKLKFDLQSSVVKKSLPLPIKVTPDNYNPQNQIEELIYREM